MEPEAKERLRMNMESFVLSYDYMSLDKQKIFYSIVSNNTGSNIDCIKFCINVMR